MDGLVFEDSQAILVDADNMSYYYAERGQKFFIRTDERDETTGLWIWESVEVEDEIEYLNGSLYSLDNGDFVFKSAHDRYGYFTDTLSVDEYVESL